jgi:ketosteroid isomerase-like protein
MSTWLSTAPREILRLAVSQENVQIIRELVDAFNRRDYAACLDAMDPDIEWHPPPDIPNAAVAIGRDALIANFEDWFGAWEDYRSVAEEILEGADETVVVFTREPARGKGSGIELRYVASLGSFSYAIARSCGNRPTSTAPKRSEPPD